MSEHLGVEAISAYLDAELDAEDEAAVREHLSACLACRHVLDELESLDRLARAAPEPAPKEGGTDLATRVRARLLAERSGTRTLQGSWLAAAAALAAVLVLPWMLLDRTREAETVPAPPAAEIGDRAPQPAIADRPPATSAPGFAPAPAKEGKKAAAVPAQPPAAFEAKPADAHPPKRKRGERAEEVAADEALNAEEVAPAGVPPPPPPASAPVETLAEDGDARADVARKGGPFAAGAARAAESGRRNAPGDDEFAALSARQVSTAGEARRWREDWRAYMRRFPASAHLSRARLALVAAGALAYRLDGRPEDLTRLRQDVEEVRRLTDGADEAAAQRILDEAQREAETQRSP